MGDYKIRSSLARCRDPQIVIQIWREAALHISQTADERDD